MRRNSVRDHDAMTELMAKAWSTYGDILNAERKQLKKKLTAIKEDKKAEPEQVAKVEGQMEDFCARRANHLQHRETEDHEPIQIRRL